MLLTDLLFDNTFVRELPADADTSNQVRQVRGALFTPVEPTPVRAPLLLAWSDEVAALLGLSSREGAAEILGGNTLAPGMAPYAARYGGHQFGNWAGQLGDGRAITLGETIGPDGQRRELQLKGAGKTPYSRTADGRAVLRSSVREFMCSEAMHHLGVPTTRALSLVGTGEAVIRDMFYDGRPEAEPGAIVCRVAPTFIRFGNFEILAAQKEPEHLRQLADWVIRTHYPELTGAENRYALWFEEICRRTAVMVAHWMRVGFVHGVMNTDNMSILGLTIDYGPYGWLEGFEPDWTPNTTDAAGRRYCYGQQPQIAHWNLSRLASALFGLFDDEAPLYRGLELFETTFHRESQRMLADKLGWRELELAAEGEPAKDEAILSGLTQLLQATETDMTLFFRGLADVPLGAADDEARLAPLATAFYDEQALQSPYRDQLLAWLHQYTDRARRDDLHPAQRHGRMNLANPKYVLRNYIAQQCIDDLAAGDDSRLRRVMAALRHPYDEQPGNEDLAARRPEWARNRPGCSALSCSS